MKKNYKVIALAVLLMFVLAGCGSSKNSYAMDSYSMDTTTEGYAMDTGEYSTDGLYDSVVMPEENGTGESGSTTSEVTQIDSTRKLIKTVNMNAETYAYDELSAKIQSRTAELGGYIEAMSVDKSYNNLRYGSFTIRIPAAKLDSFVEEIGSISNITGRSESVQDVTLTYVDLESHKAALKAEEESLITMLAKAETVADIITIQSRLTDVRYQIESMESQLRTYDNQIDYGTIYLYIDEVQTYTPAKEDSVWTRISTGFTDSLQSIGKGFKNFFVWFVVAIPYLVVWGIIIAAIILVIRAIIVGKKKKKAKKLESEKKE